MEANPRLKLPKKTVVEAIRQLAVYNAVAGKWMVKDEAAFAVRAMMPKGALSLTEPCQVLSGPGEDPKSPPSAGPLDQLFQKGQEGPSPQAGPSIEHTPAMSRPMSTPEPSAKLMGCTMEPHKAVAALHKTLASAQRHAGPPHPAGNPSPCSQAVLAGAACTQVIGCEEVGAGPSALLQPPIRSTSSMTGIGLPLQRLRQTPTCIESAAGPDSCSLLDTVIDKLKESPPPYTRPHAAYTPTPSPGFGAPHPGPTLPSIPTVRMQGNVSNSPACSLPWLERDTFKMLCCCM